MIEGFFFSIAGKKTNQVVDDLILSFLESPFISKNDKKVLKHCQSVAANGNYPSKDYFSQFYEDSGLSMKSLAEIKLYCQKALDFYHFQDTQRSITSIINESNTYQDLSTKLSSLLDSAPTQDADFLDDYQPITFSTYEDKPKTQGLTSCIPEVDACTNGFQPGTLGAICGFTGQGKSTYAVSFAFKNIREGKKCVFLSLEMSPELIWPQFEARYLFEVKGVQVTTQELSQRKLSSDVLEQVKKYDDAFRAEIASNLIILDEGAISKSIMLDYKSFSRLIRQVESKLGCIDFLVIDHVGQFELLYEDCGNRIIKQLQSFTKTYVNTKGEHPFTLMAVQANREGFKRATKRQGVYDITAISDLNECAASFTPTRVYRNGKRLNFGQVSKFREGITKCADYVSGRIVDTKVVDAFSFKESVSKEFEWRKISYVGSGQNMVFTPEHRFLINGEKVSLRELPETFMADRANWVFPNDSYQIIMGTLLGDSMITKSDGSARGTYCIRMCQCAAQKDYLDWKCSKLGEFFGEPHLQGNKRLYCACSKTFIPRFEFLTCKTSKVGGVKPLTMEVLQTLDWLALLVWYLDDGSYIQDSKNSYHLVFACTNFGESGARLMQSLLRDKFKLNSKLSIRPIPKHGTKPEIQIRLFAPDSRRFIDNVGHLCDAPSLQYKLRGLGKSISIESPYFGIEKSSLQVTQTTFTFKSNSLHKKYNFTVENENHNYLLPNGLISANCERTCSTLLFIYASDEMKVVQECKIQLLKNRLGPTMPEPVTTSFNPSICTVGSTIEKVEIDANEFNDMMCGISFDDDF